MRKDEGEGLACGSEGVVGESEALDGTREGLGNLGRACSAWVRGLAKSSEGSGLCAGLAEKCEELVWHRAHAKYQTGQYYR